MKKVINECSLCDDMPIKKEYILIKEIGKYNRHFLYIYVNLHMNILFLYIIIIPFTVNLMFKFYVFRKLYLGALGCHTILGNPAAKC